MNTVIAKGRDGFQGDTTVPLIELGEDRAIKLHTGKGNGGIRTSATVVKLEDSSNGFSSFSFIMFTDFSKTVGQDISRCTEKSITALHTKVLANIEVIKAEALAFYAAKAVKAAAVSEDEYERRVQAFENDGMTEAEIERQLDISEACDGDPDEAPGLDVGKIIMRPIGTIESGIDGSDQYLLLECKEYDLTPEQAREWLLPQVYREGGGAGTYFCHTVLSVQAPYSTNRVICTVQHRYDI